MGVWVGEGKDRLGERMINMFVAVTNLWNERALTTRVKFSRSHSLYYTTNIRSVLTFASLVWGSLITNKDKKTIHRVERAKQ